MWSGSEMFSMDRQTPIAIGQIAFFFITSIVLASPAVGQKPTQAQIGAIRQACRSDYQTYCASVPTGGAAALACLQQNASSLSGPCQRAVGSAAPTTQTQQPPPASAAAPGTAPAARTSPPPVSPGQEAVLLRRSCGPDFRAYCRDVPPGGGRIIACLEANGPSLSRPCRSALISARQGR